MRHANGVSPRMRSWLQRFLISFSVMALVALGAIAAAVPFAAMSDAAEPRHCGQRGAPTGQCRCGPSRRCQSKRLHGPRYVCGGGILRGHERGPAESYRDLLVRRLVAQRGGTAHKCRRHPRSQSRCGVLSSVRIMCGDRLVFRPRRQPTGFRRHPGARRVGPGRRVIAAERRGKSGRATAWHFVRDHELMRGRGYLPGQ